MSRLQAIDSVRCLRFLCEMSPLVSVLRDDEPGLLIAELGESGCIVKPVGISPRGLRFFCVGETIAMAGASPHAHRGSFSSIQTWLCTHVLFAERTLQKQKKMGGSIQT
mmetsp:Transcript_144946/g.270145  ORF Transcript_144946/g.270145 Transcript_144946/m.270145 type:complete len:109 (-) Transcript_144946:40-366(-)